MTIQPPATADYYARRAEQERAAAARATEGTARTIHLHLAERYAALATERRD